MRILLVLLILAPVAHAGLKAKVLLVKGTATKLLPGANQAVAINMGDVLPEDTSIVTREKSFLRLKFSDNSIMNIAPKSMIVVSKMPKDKAQVIKLFNGVIQAKVEKEKKRSKTKLIVRTKNAVLGVRGTKFQSFYNSGNNTTSIVTVEGKVAMVKRETKAMEVKDSPSAKGSIPEESVDELDNAFDQAEDVIEVPEGKYTGVGDKTAKPIEPVKIAPAQYDAMAKSLGSEKRAKDVMKVSSKEELAMAKSNGVKSGGYVDFQTGLYVPPAKSAKFDKVTGTYEAPKLGTLSRNGDFVPTRGVKIDKKKGLIVDREEIGRLAKADKAKVLNQLDDINQSQKDVPLIVNKTETKQVKEEPSTFWKWLPDDHVLTAKFMPYSEELHIQSEQFGEQAKGMSDTADWMIFTWQQNWNEKWSSRLRMGETVYEADQEDFPIATFDDGYSSGNRSDSGYFSVGVLYNLSPKLRLGLDIVDRGVFFLVPEFGGDFSLRDTSVQSLDLSARYSFSKWFNAEFIIHEGTDMRIPSNDGNEDPKGTYRGATLMLEAEWMYNKTLGIYPSVFYRMMEQKGDEFEFFRRAGGIGLDFIWDV